MKVKCEILNHLDGKRKLCKTCLVCFSGSGDVEAYFPSLCVLRWLVCDF